MGTKLAQAVKAAIMAGGIRYLEWDDQVRVVKALKILEGLPDKYDEVKEEPKKEKLK